MDGFAGRHIVRSVAGSCVQDRGAEGVALEERFFGGRSMGWGMTTASWCCSLKAWRQPSFRRYRHLFRRGRRVQRSRLPGPSAFPSGPLNRRLGSFFAADDDDRHAAKVHGLPCNVFEAVVVEAAFNLDGVDEGRADGKAQDGSIVAVGLVHFRELALVTREEDRRIGPFAGDVQQAFHSWIN